VQVLGGFCFVLGVVEGRGIRKSLCIALKYRSCIKLAVTGRKVGFRVFWGVKGFKPSQVTDTDVFFFVVVVVVVGGSSLEGYSCVSFAYF
jgi:hypothetical protein